MNPLEQRIQELERQIAELKTTVQSLTNPSELSPHLISAINSKLLKELSVSSKGSSTEDVSVDEAGAGNYSVMGDPDGFLEVDISGTTYYLPYFG